MDGKPPPYEDLVELAWLQACQIEQLRDKVERLKTELEQSKRAGKRQTTPLSKGESIADPKRADQP